MASVLRAWRTWWCAIWLLCGTASAALAVASAPTPTLAELNRPGALDVQHLRLAPEQVSGFGGAQVWLPVSGGPYGLLVLSPGYLAFSDTLSSWGERLSAHGFVVAVIDTRSLLDWPDERAPQLLAALAHLVSLSGQAASPLHGKVDGQRMAVGGHSMGGSAALLAALANPKIKLTLPMAPWHPVPSAFKSLKVPSLVLACEADSIAPVAQHAAALHQAMPQSLAKGYIEMRGEDHLCVMTGSGQEADWMAISLAWLKRHLDGDRRYAPLLCGRGPTGLPQRLKARWSACPG